MRIAMLSGPRNISTAVMRSFENRPDTVVADEPFYACYLKASGANHPMREEVLASQPQDWEAVARDLSAPKSAPCSFEKHIAFHFAFAPSFDWLKGARVFHLIRNPRAMVASYASKHGEVSPVIDSYRIQRRLYEQAPAPVIDADDVLAAPEPMLRALCAALGIPFLAAMLSWPSGPRASDGVWAAHWYDAVLASTGFQRSQKPAPELPPELEALAGEAMDDYRFFHARRLKAV